MRICGVDGYEASEEHLDRRIHTLVALIFFCHANIFNL